MHFTIIGVNVQPDPVRFVQINTEYWVVHNETSWPKWTQLGYKLPVGCKLSIDPLECPDLDPDNGVKFCQVCPANATKWSYADWILTVNPSVFGLINGCANPTGVGLIIVLTIMVICSMPFVRRSGWFQVSFFLLMMAFRFPSYSSLF